MNIHMILVTYAIDPYPLISNIGKDVVWHIFTHSHNTGIRTSIGDLAHEGYDIILNDWEKNRGLATSWNDGILECPTTDVIIVINDDVMASPDDISILARTCIDHPEAGIITAWGFNERMGDVRDNGYSLFGINRIAIERVGYFDQNYTPIYGEDVDLTRRLALEDIPILSCTETNIWHKGSATTNGSALLTRQHQVTFPRNEDYHRLKHGGGYGHEQFLCPFDDINLSWYISAESRENPYPGHERQDKDIVKV